MKLIHCADIHLDSPMQTHMTAQQASVRNTEMLQSFVRLTEFAQERAVRAVLIAGDLFDGARVRARTVDALLAAIRRTPEVDYLYLPGNHDEAANAFCDCALPENLKVFGKKWTTYRYDGIAISGAQLGLDAAFYEALPHTDGAVNLVMLHGGIGTACGEDMINLNLLKNRGIDYLALGHIHSYQTGPLDETGSYCYPGCLEGRGFDECGEKGFVLLTVEDGSVAHEFVPFSARQLHRVPVDITKQRLSIARALSRKPEILVFDDSFSALDYKTDAKLREGLNEKLKDTTKIIVAQRISTIRHADKIIVLDRGEAVGMGTHEELMKNCDVYKEIALSQLSAAELA